MSLSDVFINRPDLLDDKKKLESVFADFYAGDAPKVRRMMRAYDIGALSALVDGRTDDIERKKLIDILVNQYDMQETKAQDAIREWFVICSPAVVAAFKRYLSDQERQKAQEQDAEIQKEIQAREDAEAAAERQRNEEEALEKVSEILDVNYDDYSRYLNVDLSHGPTVRGIPCGVGSSDYGFEIKGVGRPQRNANPYDEEPYPAAQALVYNFLVRNTHITRDAYPTYMRTHHFQHELDYGHVYRYMMMLLEMLQPSGKTLVNLQVLGDQDELVAAVDILNEYLAVFSRLIRVEPCSIEVQVNARGKSISVESPADICVENYTEDHGLRRRLRYAKRINYNLGDADKGDLEFLLQEISPFKSFKKGQYAALCSMMNANDHAVCIMPTGSGKSLIYYMACILQPQVTFVVSPTNILIRDQIRNLGKFHHFDSVTHLELQVENDYSFYRPGTSLVFLTPATFQNRNLFGIFKRWRNKIGYVVLDEIHCISNWGHDFRPEYLMLSKNMKQYLEDARYLGFTATANYTVAQDIQRQLNIPQENFFSPVLFEKFNVRYDFRQVDSANDMYAQVKQVADDIVRRGERALVFTKSDEISRKVADAIGYEADVFTRDNPESYGQFAEGLCRILVATEDMGIGVNLPDVNCTVHFGVPVSKNEFVQEIGRAGRADEKVTSYVIYLKPTEDNIPARLFKRETVVDNLPQILEAMHNDYADAYHKLNCGDDTSEILYDRLIDVFSDFRNKEKVLYVIDHLVSDVEPYKQLLYMLYVTGYIKDWYSYKALDHGRKVQIIVDICSVPGATGHRVVALSDDEMLARMKRKSRKYFASMGNDRESISKVTNAGSIKEILMIYVKWYYEKFLYHHKEEFLDFMEFLLDNKDCNTLKITEDIEDYFTLPFIQIKEDEEQYSSMTFAEISEQLIAGVSKNTLSNLERINSDNYSYKIDYLLFMGNWRRNGRFDVSRLERFWSKLSAEEQEEFYSVMVALYPLCNGDAQWKCLKYLDDRTNVTNLTLRQTVDRIYEKQPKDKMFYGVMAAYANARFNQFIRL